MGWRAFARGWYIYVGSARGAGGFARTRRHVRLAQGNGQHPHWHIDHLLLSDHFRLREVICAPTDIPLECDLARAIGGNGVAGFGASDCRCTSHLFFRPENPHEEIVVTMARLGLIARSITLK